MGGIDNYFLCYNIDFDCMVYLLVYIYWYLKKKRIISIDFGEGNFFLVFLLLD